MAARNSTRRAQSVSAADANPMIGCSPRDTINKVQAVLRYLAIVAGEGIGSVPNTEDNYGMSLILDTCATALDFPMEGGAV